MANCSSDWSKETYRLDEIPSKFKFPVLIQVSEGYYSENEVETFSVGDIIMFDQCIEVQKVAARFAVGVTETSEGDDYEILKEEILIPLNYKGKLKAKNEIKKYDSVRELAADMPRYARVLEDLRVDTGEKQEVTINADTVLELDRVIPAQHNKKSDRLIFNYETEHYKQVGVLVDRKCKFRTVPDRNEYSLREVIDRYELPQVVCFVDNQLQKVYTQDLVERVEQMVNVTTSALQIRRLVKQKCLFGHYRVPDQSVDEVDGSCKRTLVIVPLDSTDVKEIMVKIHMADIEGSIYETLATRKVDHEHTKKEMTESLYVDFVKKPRVLRLEQIKSADRLEKGLALKKSDEPPALPPRPFGKLPSVPPRAPEKTNGRLNGTKQSQSPSRHVYKNHPSTHSRDQTNVMDDGAMSMCNTCNYILPDSPKLPKSPLLPTKAKSVKHKTKKSKTKSPPPSPDLSFSLADVFDTHTSKDGKHQKRKHGFFRKGKKEDKNKKDVMTPVRDEIFFPSPHGSPTLVKYSNHQGQPQEIQSGAKNDNTIDDKDNHQYNEPDEWLIPTPKTYKHDPRVHLPATENIDNPPPLPNRIINPCIAKTDSCKQESDKMKVKDAESRKQEMDYKKLGTDQIPGRLQGMIPNSETCQEKQEILENENIEKLPALPKKYNKPPSTNMKTKDPEPRKEEMHQTHQEKIDEQKRPIKDSRPVATVSPTSSRPPSAIKEFHLLSVEELHERLVICGMKDFANFCYDEKINGEFLTNMDEDTLKSMELSKFQVKKLKQIMSGWISK